MGSEIVYDQYAGSNQILESAGTIVCVSIF